MPDTSLLSEEEVGRLVRDKRRLFDYLRRPPDMEHSCARVISSLNQAIVTLRMIDELYFEGGYDPDEEAKFIFAGAFRGRLPLCSERDMRKPGAHEHSLRDLRASLEADLEKLESIRMEGGRNSSEAEKEFAYKLRRSLEEEISRMRADQDGENTGYHLQQRPSRPPELPFASQCGYTAAAAAQHIKDAAISLLAGPLMNAGYDF